MHRVIRADVPEPLWDQWRGIMIVPSRLTEVEADDAVAQLVRERSAGRRRSGPEVES